MMTRIFRCPVCGGVDVSAQAWVNPNFLSKRHEDVNWIDEPYVLCDGCETVVRDWDDSTELEFDGEGLVVTDDGRHITLERWAEENPLNTEEE